MPAVVLDLRITDTSPIKPAVREFRRILREVLRETAKYFARNMLSSRFAPHNDSRFHHAPRNNFYKQSIKRRRGDGQGKFVNNVLTGSTRRRALSSATVTATANKSRVKINVPMYFTNPFVGSYSQNGTLKRIRQQPDKAAETKHIDSRDAYELRRFSSRLLTRKLRELRNASTTTIKGS